MDVEKNYFAYNQAIKIIFLLFFVKRFGHVSKNFYFYHRVLTKILSNFHVQFNNQLIKKKLQ